MRREDLTEFLDNYLKIKEIPDESLNGLQVEGPEEIDTIATAVDGAYKTFQAAIESGAQLLLVHHGLFWGKPFPLRGIDFSRIEALIKGGIGLYACHLPLDLHPEVGNNIQLAHLLELREIRAFGYYHGIQIGYAGNLPTPTRLEDLRAILDLNLGTKSQAFPFGEKQIKSVAIVSGRGGSSLNEGLGKFDLILTGEPDLSLYRLAEDVRQSIIFAGHYATESLGIRALGDLLAQRFSLEHHFLELPAPF